MRARATHVFRLRKVIMKLVRASSAWALGISLICLLASGARAYDSYGLTSDAIATSFTVRGQDWTTLRAGTSQAFAVESQAAVFVFELPAIPAGTFVSQATFNVRASNSGSTPTFNGDLYGLTGRTSPAVLAADFYSGTFGGDATDAVALQDNAFTPPGVTNFSWTDFALSPPALTSYLNSTYALLPGSGARYAFVRVSPDFTTFPGVAGTYFGYQFTCGEWGTDGGPRLSITYVTPEPGSAAVTVGAFTGWSLLARRRASRNRRR
jgi:hypothetical protein